MARSRLDRLVVERGLAPTREKARRLILAGEVLVNEAPADKPGTLVRDEAVVRLRRPLKSFVGRGGDKLSGALDALGIDVEGSSVLDVGASTGGFTDCLLKRGARKVVAVDVGKGQLDWSLVGDPRVEVRDEVNARYLTPADFSESFDLVTMDVSFISAAKVLPAVSALVAPGGRLLVLVKPQFELAPEAVERGGIVRDPERRLEAILAVARAVVGAKLALEGVVAAPIKGAMGNQEFFLLARRARPAETASVGLDLEELERAARDAVRLTPRSPQVQ